MLPGTWFDSEVVPTTMIGKPFSLHACAVAWRQSRNAADKIDAWNGSVEEESQEPIAYHRRRLWSVS
jgi:hypothetical protein